jgi:hypothetical protein
MSVIVLVFGCPAITKDPRAQTDQRPKSAKARCRGRLGTGFAASYVDLMLAPISTMGRTPARRQLHGWSQARSGECDRHFRLISERGHAQEPRFTRQFVTAMILLPPQPGCLDTRAGKARAGSRGRAVVMS